MNYGIIGCGKMGVVILESLLTIISRSSDNIIVSDIEQTKLDFVKKKFSIKTTNSNLKLTNISDVIILAIKPQQIKSVLLELKSCINIKKLIVSIVAGVKISFIEHLLAKKVAIVRCMPNLPLKYGFGLTAFCYNNKTTSLQKHFIKTLFSAHGKVIEVKENKLDSVTAISGSGPAYIFYISEIMQKIAKKFGFDTKTAKLLVNQTIFGAAQMLSLSNLSAKELKENVTSKGGTTQQALETFYKEGLEQIFFSAITKAKLRAKELSKMLK